MALLHITLKKKHRRVMAILTFLGNTPLMAISNNYCIKTWQSWDFKSLRSFTDTRLFIFEEYPCGTFTLHRHLQKLVFSFLDNVWHAGRKYVRWPCDIKCNCLHIPITTKSWWVFKSSFVLSLMLRSVPIKLSHTFFSTCITFIQFPTSRTNQYGRSKDIDLFFHMFFSIVSFF